MTDSTVGHFYAVMTSLLAALLSCSHGNPGTATSHLLQAREAFDRLDGHVKRLSTEAAEL